MPELPEVETVVRTLKSQIIGEKIQDVLVTWPRTVYESETFIHDVSHQRILDITRRGKYLIFTFEKGYMSVHLRMEGRFFLTPLDEEPKKHTHVVFILSNQKLEFNDTRKFGRMQYSLNHPQELLTQLGYEPFDEALTPSVLKQLAKTRSIPLKTFLLDQSVIAGIGNIYADEICFLSSLSPLKKVKTLTLKQWQELLGITRMVLSEAILAGGATVRTYTASLGITGRFQSHLRVYGRGTQNCLTCASPLKSIKIGQRTSVYCPQCQKG
jgi:formamidopyrimidine-DNA glycosylase